MTLALGQRVVWAAPGRVCLAGESLDWMTGGESVCASLPVRTTATVYRTGAGGPAVVSASGPLSAAVQVDPGESVHAAGPLAHLAACVRVVGLTRDVGGLALSTSTHVPLGAGAASSAAVTVAAVAALLAATGKPADLADVLALARHAEADEVGTGCGWMDFLSVGHGGVCAIRCGEEPSTRRLRAALGEPLLLIDTQEQRTTREVLASKRERFQNQERDMMAYVRQAPDLVAELVELLSAPVPHYRQVGRVLTETHNLLRDRVKCSTPTIEQCVRAVLDAGAYGAKLTGSGHGGLVLALVPREAMGRVLAAVAGAGAVHMFSPDMDYRGLANESGEVGFGLSA